MKKGIQKYLVFLMVLSLVIGLFAGCGGGNSTGTNDSELSGNAQGKPNEQESESKESDNSGEKKKITFWNGFTASDGVILTEIVDRYNENNTDGIFIEMDIIPWANFHEKLPQAIATNTAPTFVLMGNGDIPNYSHTDSIQPMDDYWELEGSNKDEFESSTLELFQYEGKQMGIPMQVNATYLYWNKDIYDAVGLDPEKPPETWEELLEFAVKCTDPSKNWFGFGIATGTGFANNILKSYGLQFVDQETKKATANSPEIVEVLKMVQEYTVKHKVSPPSSTGADLDQMLFSGSLAMWTNGPWLINGCRENELNFGICNQPAGSEGQQAIIGGVAHMIPSGTSEEDKQAAYKFIRHWNTPEICKEWSIRNGFPPYLKSVVEDPEIKEDSILSELVKGMSYGAPLYTELTTISKINDDALSPALEQIFFGNADVESELNKANEMIDEILKAEP